MKLRGRVAIVRPWRTSDAAALVRHGNNINVAKQLRDRFPHPYTPADARAFLDWAGSGQADPGNLAIEVAGEAVGGVGFSVGIDIERFSAEVGYWVGETCWGRGIATEALTLMTAHLFDRLNLLRVYALPFAENRASARVLEKAGYVCEGRLRAACVKDGAVRDQLLYACVNDDWKGVTR
jgi:[ribosomal protein S5]-alanine N-acetyltransferase